MNKNLRNKLSKDNVYQCSRTKSINYKLVKIIVDDEYKIGVVTELLPDLSDRLKSKEAPSFRSVWFTSNELDHSISKEEQIVSQLFYLEKKQKQLLDQINHLAKKESILKQNLNLESTELDRKIYELKNRTILDNLEAFAIISFSKSWNISILDTAKYISIILAVTLYPLAILLLLLGFYLQQKSIWPLKNYFLNKGIKTTFPSLIDGLPPYIQDNLIYDGQKYFSITPVQSVGEYFIPKILISGNITKTIPVNSGNTQLNKHVSHGTKFVYNFVAQGYHFLNKINTGTKSNTYYPIKNGLVINNHNIKQGEVISPKLINHGLNVVFKFHNLNIGKTTPIFIISNGEKIFSGIVNSGKVKILIQILNGTSLNNFIIVSPGNKLKLNRISIKGNRPKLNNSIFPGRLISNIKPESILFYGKKVVNPSIHNWLITQFSKIKTGLTPFISKEFIPVEAVVEKEKTAFEIEHGMTEEDHYKMLWERPGDYLTDYEKRYGK